MYRWQYDTAAHYAKAAIVLNKQMDQTGSIDLVLPVIMCQLLAVELLLKSLILRKHPGVFDEDDLRNNKIDIRGHHLQALYVGLDESTRSSIDEEFGKPGTNRTSETTFAQLLRELGEQPFVDWRYYYEKSTTMQLRRDAVETVLEVLGKTASRIFAT
jgi:hypothetical protein